MRIVSTIDRPLADEHVIGVDPPLRPEQPGVWRRRINPFTGRSLGDRALTAEQDARAGVQRLRGQSVTAGIVSGLDLIFDDSAIGAAPGAARLHLAPGIALARSGEDIVVSTPRDIALGDLPVRARADVLDAIISGAAAPPPPGAPGDGILPGGAFAGLFPLLPRRLAKPTLGGLVAAPAAPALAALPPVAILVAQPVTATILASARDDCAPDPRDDPFDDLQLIDGVRLLLDFWPAEMVARSGGADYRLPDAGADRRNRLAWRVFGVEAAMLPGEMHPWEEVGVPLALLGFNPDWTLAMVDRASVVRLGGRPLPRTPLVPRSGTATLWQARVAQLAEQLADLPDMAPSTVSAALREVPPVGFLPIDVVDLASRRQSFFPAGSGLTLAPMPMEQIDLVVAESAALDPIDLRAASDVELLVPVPEKLYEPGLLEIATVDHAFGQAITRAAADRTDWLVRREQVRRRRDVLLDGATGQRAIWSTDGTADELLPQAANRAPVGCTRVREMTAPAGGGPRSLLMTGAHSTLTSAKGDTVSLWVRIDESSAPTGILLRLMHDEQIGGTADFTHAVFWGAADQFTDAAGKQPTEDVRMGPLPPAGVWTRLDVPVDRIWTPAGASLTGFVANGMMTSQRGGTVRYGPLSRIDANGMELVWIGDDAPPGALLSDTANPNGTGWPFVPAGIDAAPDPAEDAFGTAEAGGMRGAIAMTAFRARWPQSSLTAEFATFDDDGIDGFVRKIDARLKSTNDAIDLGFVRARSDIYRVRQYMLGADAASRLVTSPALADLSVREESARAKGLDIVAFVRSASAATVTLPLATTTTTTTTTTGTAAASGTATAGVTKRAGVASTTLFQNFNLFSASTASSRAFAAASTPMVAETLAVRPAAVTASLSPAAFLATAPSASIATTATAKLFGSEISGMAAIRAASLISARLPGIVDVQQSTPLPSSVERTASVAERLASPPAVEAHAYAVAGKMAVINTIAALIFEDANTPRRGIALGDLPCPGYRFPADPTQALAAAPRNTVADVIADLAKTPDKRAYLDLDEMKDNATGVARHESDYFTSAVSAIDNTIALMRLVEARIALYNDLVADAGAVRAELMGHVVDTDARLRAIAVQIEEARQDFAMATALLAEEQARVAALNAKRKAILDANAQVVLFRRPRVAKRVRPVPTLAATAALEEAPILACARDHPAVPEEIQTFVGLLREAPVAWFPNVHPHLDRIDRLDTARAALAAVQQRAQQPPIVPLAMTLTAAAPRFLVAVGQLMVAQRQVSELRRLAALQLDQWQVQQANLATARRVLLEQAAMADLIAADHNRAILAKAAAEEIERIGMAAACLHDSFGEVPPIDRLAWAELLSEFDAPAPLRDLNGLEGWSALPIELRKTQQGLVDWLFGRIDPTIQPALTAINALVRVCLLMAAHAPVDRLITARLVAPAPAKIGARLSLYADTAVARIGMTALVRDASAQLIAHAVVEDLQDGVAHTRIVKTFAAVATIGASARFELSDLRLPT